MLDADASHDVALGMISRLDRLGPGASPLPSAGLHENGEAAPRLALAGEVAAAGGGRVWAVWLAVGALLLSALAYGPAAALRPSAWGGTSKAIAPIPDSLTALPEPRVSDGALRRCRGLAEVGRVYDALAECSRIGPGDARRAEADALVARIQRELLAVSPTGRPSAGGGDAR